MNEESKLPKHQKGHRDVRIPHEMQVMAVDSDRVVLKILVAMLRKCGYQVTGETEAEKALDMLRRNPEKYDIVITDVVRDDMDGFKILETIGLEMDIPVIMLSASDDKNNIMRAIIHGARDYISKPVRVEVLRNIWQHVLRKRLSDNRNSTIADDQNLGSSIETIDLAVAGKEPTTHSQCDGNAPGARKKARLTWSPELHKKFINAVKSLGVKEAVPKKILEFIDEPRITRENVASHLQKYRKMLKKQELEKSKNEDSRAEIGCSSINMQLMKTSKGERYGGSRTASGLGQFVTGTGHSINPFSTAYAASHTRYAQMLSYNSLNNQGQHSNWLRSAPSPNFPTLTDLATMANLKPQAFSTSQLGPQNRPYNHLASTPLLGIDYPDGSSHHHPVGYHYSNNQHLPLLMQGNAFPSVPDPAMESIVLTPLPKSSSGEEFGPTMTSSANAEGTIYESSSGANELLEGILGSGFYKNKQSSSDDNLNAILNQFTSDGVPRLH
ncbi:hypothetical protein MLD38_014523 [Melastoma candidum]|uniref:Uncharacterized protein n=1 Tax=Melastoma candidum TaxID=119954 RepID=A0ACB9RG68_9MYRT|nr:hypothetical protein MLD38_014523 [Melastoma candidum]